MLSSLSRKLITNAPRSSLVTTNQSLLLTNQRNLHSTVKKESLLATSITIAAVALGGSALLENLAKKRTEQQQPQQSSSEAGEKLSPFSFITGIFSAKGYYQGGFEDQMTKREAALILGVRESATREKIREAHRLMSRINHPDTGGSPYIAMKINEAKDLLLNSK